MAEVELQLSHVPILIYCVSLGFFFSSAPSLPRALLSLCHGLTSTLFFTVGTLTPSNYPRFECDVWLKLQAVGHLLFDLFIWFMEARITFHEAVVCDLRTKVSEMTIEVVWPRYH